MATTNRVLALDIGTTGIKLAEFEFDAANRITLAQFATDGYGEELDESNRSLLIQQTLNRLLGEQPFTARRALVSISGQFALTRFVKLPPVSGQETRVKQIVEFEARQNVPFPIEEVVWDYQLIANPEAEELEVMFVVIKNEIVDEITAAIQAVGLNPILVDVASCASYNAARANGIGVDECTMVLDIGGRSTNLMFVDRNQFFTRTIPIAGISITQQIAKELGVTMAEAEEIKLRHGFVGLGGAYEDPASEVAAAVSKIIRGVMTRLHGEINRSITLYRSHQKGERPHRLYLAGGSSVLNYADNFFAEKMGIEVEYFNPFKVIRVSSELDLEQLEEKAHNFSQLIGLALRYRGACPVEVNLLPERLKRQIALNQKKPYLIGAACCLVLLLAFSLVANLQKVQIYEPKLAQLQGQRSELEHKQREITDVERQISQVRTKYDSLRQLLQRREQWVGVANAVEQQVPELLWIVEFRPIWEQPPDQGMDPGRPGRAPMAPGMPGRMTMPREHDLDYHDLGYYDETMPTEVETEEPGPQGRIIGLVIRGSSLVSADLNREDSRPGREIDLPGIDLPIPQTLPESPPAAAATGGGQGPEQVFLARLQQSPWFVAEETGFEDYQVSDQVLNLRRFTIRAMLETPLDLEY